MAILGSRSLGIAAALAVAALLGCAPTPRPGPVIAVTDPESGKIYRGVDAPGVSDGVHFASRGAPPRFVLSGLAFASEADMRGLLPVVVAARVAGTPLSPARAAGTVVIVLPSRALVESEVLGASRDHRPSQIAFDIDKTEAELLVLARSAQASRLFDRVSFIRSDLPEAAETGDSDYRIWAQQGSDSFIWHLDARDGDHTEIGFERPEDFPAAAFAAVRRLGGSIQTGIGATMIRVGNNRVFQTAVTPTQEDVLLEIHDRMPPTQRHLILRHVMASKVFRKYQPLIEARAKLYCPDDYSIGFNFIGKRLIYPAIGCRVYCE